MAEPDERLDLLERWLGSLDEEVSRLRTVLLAIGTVASQASPPSESE